MVAGVSELHLEIIVDRLRREFNIEAAVGPTTPFFKEALSTEAIGEMKYTGVDQGRHEYAHVKVRLSPRPDGSGYLFDNQILGDSIPSRFVPAIEHAIDAARLCGVSAGHPVDDVKVELFDGSYHDVDSTDSAFRIAARQAFVEGAIRAKPKVVEPVMRVEVVVPEEFLAGVMADLDRRQAQIQSSDQHAEWCTIVARVSFGRLLGYAPALNEHSRGRATYSMHFDCYQQRDLFSDEGDRDSLVGVPRKPIVPNRESAIALPEPDEDDDLDEGSPQPQR